MKICSEHCFEIVVNQNSHKLALYNGHFDPVSSVKAKLVACLCH